MKDYLIKFIRMYGIIILLLGSWFIFQNLYNVIFNKTGKIYIWAFYFFGAFLHILCGIGLLKLKNWARYIFMILMLYHLYRQINPVLVFLYRIQLGNVVGTLPEIFVGFFIILAVILPVLSIWFFSIEKVKSKFI